jgi:hypothetical protein
MSKLLLALALCCGLTCLIEIVPALFLRDRKKWVKVSLINNVITNPILNTLILVETVFQYEIYPKDLFYSWMVKLDYLNVYVYAHNIFVLLLEVAVIIFEAWVYRKMVGASWKKCLLFSVVANVVSFGIGILLEPIFNIPLGSEFLKWLTQ